MIPSVDFPDDDDEVGTGRAWAEIPEGWYIFDGHGLTYWVEGGELWCGWAQPAGFKAVLSDMFASMTPRGLDNSLTK